MGNRAALGASQEHARVVGIGCRGRGGSGGLLGAGPAGSVWATPCDRLAVDVGNRFQPGRQQEPVAGRRRRQHGAGAAVAGPAGGAAAAPATARDAATGLRLGA